MFLQCFVALRIKSRLAKVASAESSPKMRDQKRHGAARSTCGSQNVKNTSAPEHVCNQLWCEAQNARCFGPLLDGASQIFRGRRNGFGTLSKVSKQQQFPKRWRQWDVCRGSMSHGRRSTRDSFIKDVWRSEGLIS